MEVINYNDSVRNYIYNNIDKKSEDKYGDLTKALSNDKDKISSYIGVMYLTSFIVNNFTLNRYPNDEISKNNM